MTKTNTRSRIVSVLLALVMLVSLMPNAAGLQKRPDRPHHRKIHVTLRPKHRGNADGTPST